MMKSRKKVVFVLLCFWLIAGIPYGSMAADKSPSPPLIKGITLGQDIVPDPVPDPDPVPVTPPGNDGLLSGMTPGDYAIPSGWTLVSKQDFEGSMPSSEDWGGSKTSVKTDIKHSGSKSFGGTYASGQASVYWELSGDSVGSWTELYFSFYEYIENQARFNDEFFLARIMKRGSDGDSQDQHWFIDWFWAPTYNNTNATLYILGESGSGKGNEYRLNGKSGPVGGGGQWVQWEIHYRQNASGQSDGFTRIYRDGNLYTSAENANLNGKVSMSNAPIQIGGLYTLLVWMTDYPACTSCGSEIGDGTDACTAANDWWYRSFSDPVCNKPLASFNRYFDDIIIMKK